MDYESCFVFHPSREEIARPSKRRRVELHGLQESWPHRRRFYERLWHEQRSRLIKVLTDLNEATVSSVNEFIQQASDSEAEKLPSVVLVTGPSLASHDALFDQISKASNADGRSVFVSLKSGQAPNLKTLLKHLISEATSHEVTIGDEDEDELVEPKRKGPRLLSYDLQILHNAVEEKRLQKVVVAFQDCEAFDGAVLSDVIELISCWKNRIPFVLLFGVATSIEGLQSKLSRRAVRSIQGRRFDVVQAEAALEQLFQALHTPQSKLWLGSSLCGALLSRQRDHVQSLEAFIDAVQYSYMVNSYANATSLFLDLSLEYSDIPNDHFEAVRNLPSFSAYAQKLLTLRQPSLVRRLLDDDRTLFDQIHKQIQIGQEQLLEVLNAIEILTQLQASLNTSSPAVMSDLHILALSGKLASSTTVRNLLLSVRRASSETLLQLLQDLNAVADGPLRESVEALLIELEELLATQKEGDAPLRSEENIKNSTLRTTVIARKVELSKQKSTLTKADNAFSDILNRFAQALENHFDATLIDPKNLPFHEIFLYDLKSPHREVFTPKPRFAIERALSAPHDYLDCDCCATAGDNKHGDEEAESSLSATQPATAILYQLYLEGGALVNATDLRSAFVTILSDKVDDEDMLAALFQRSLAELRYLGLIKGTKRRADHVIKVAWKGL